jgi:F-type H+-transporting ATPase subunit delta
MSEGPLAKRYAGALLHAAIARGALEQVMEELHSLITFLAENPIIAIVLDSPLIDKKKRERSIQELCKNRYSALLHNFLRLLNQKGRLPLLALIEKEFQLHYDAITNRVKVELTSAVELSPEEEERLHRALVSSLAAEVRLEKRVDPQILGGVVFKIEGKVADASLRRQLSKLHDTLIWK